MSNTNEKITVTLTRKQAEALLRLADYAQATLDGQSSDDRDFSADRELHGSSREILNCYHAVDTLRESVHTKTEKVS